MEVEEMYASYTTLATPQSILKAGLDGIASG